MVRAVLIATGYLSEMEPLVQHRPTPLFRIADRPIIFHIIEFLLRQGIKKFDLILHHLPHMIEEKLGEGKRWGVTINYHLAKSSEHPFTTLKPAAQGWENETIIMGYADCLPKLSHDLFSHIQLAPDTLIHFPNLEWSGWSILTTKTLISLPSNLDISQFPQQFPDAKTIKTSAFLSVRGFQNLKKSNLKFISQQSPSHFFPTTARMIEPNIWISRAVSMHPSVKINPPVFIGNDCQIKENVEIGPYVVVEKKCIIDNKSVIENSLICQNSYVGEDLLIQNSIIDRNLLVNLTHDTKIAIQDDFILCELTPPKHLHWFPYTIIEKFLAALFFLVLSPIYFTMRLLAPLSKETVLRLPAPEDQVHWKTFDLLSFNLKITKQNKWKSFFKRIPALLNILKGELHFIGVAPRSIKDTAALPTDWQKLYLKSKVGLITLDTLDNVQRNDQYASEAFYAINMGVYYDLKLGMRWIGKKIKSLFI